MPPKKKIARGAAGLPRYYMDCGWYRHPHFAGLGLDSLALFEACVGYSCEHATDGRLPADHEDLAAALGLRASAVKKALKPLVDRGRITLDGDMLQVRDFTSHNPSADEIDAYMEERSTAGAKGNHIRHHVNKGRRSDDCEFCRSSDPGSDRSSDPTAVANGSHGMGWDGSTSSSPPPTPTENPTDVDAAGAAPEEEQPRNPTEARTRLVDAAIAHMAECDRRRHIADGNTIRTPAAWLAKAAENRRAANGTDLANLAARMNPDMDPAELAEHVDADCGPLDGGRARAARAIAAAEADLAAEQARRDEIDARTAKAAAWLDQLDPEQRAALEARAEAATPALGDGTKHPTLVRRKLTALALERLDAETRR